MAARAKNPERVMDKVRESDFFLTQMANYEKALHTEKFLYCLSAFMSAFRTIVFRLYGVTENRLGAPAKHELQKQLHNHFEINFLIQRTNVELHEDGAVVFQRYTAHVSDSAPSRWESKFRPDTNRFASRFTSRYVEAVVIRCAAGWQFAENSKNLVQLCHDALGAIEGFIKQALATDPSAAKPSGGI